jgi:hypothetical protein
MKRSYIVVLVLSAACGDQLGGGGDDGPDSAKSPLVKASISVEDAIVPATDGSGADNLHAFVFVTPSPCVALGNSFGGTFRGAPMDVVELGGKNGTGECSPAVLEVDLAKVASGDPVVEVFDSKASVTVTLTDDIMDTRNVTGSFSGTFVLCGGDQVTLQWSNAEDFASAAAAGRAAFHETCAGGGCTDLGTFSAELAPSGPKALGFTVPKGTSLNHGGTGQIEFSFPGAERQGDAPDCDGAAACSYHFTHPTINKAELDRSGC